MDLSGNKIRVRKVDDLAQVVKDFRATSTYPNVSCRRIVRAELRVLSQRKSDRKDAVDVVGFDEGDRDRTLKVSKRDSRRHPCWASICDVRREGGKGVKKCSKFAHQQYRFCGQKREGVKKFQNYVDIIYGSPL